MNRVVGKTGERSEKELAADDAEDLFETSTVEEIRQIEKKTRSDIEGKKEELRQLVGARYRDLIESADSIMDMRRLSTSVVNCIETVQTDCSGLHSTLTQPDTVLAHKAKDQADLRKTFTTGCLVKFLADTPEQLWICLDNSRVLDAANRYREAERVYGHILNEQENIAAKTLASWPLLQHLWTSVRVFRPHMIRACRSRLRRPGLADSEYARALCALVLLDNLSASQALQIFLQTRTTWLTRYISEASTLLVRGPGPGPISSPNTTTNTRRSTMSSPAPLPKSAPPPPQPGATAAVRDALCSVSEAILLTVCHMAGAFLHTANAAADPPLLLTLLRHSMEAHSSTSISDAMGTSAGAALSDLVESVANLTVEEVRDACRQWLDSCAKEVHVKGLDLLSTVAKASDLADMRQAVHKEIFSFETHDSRRQEASGSGPEVAVNFGDACSAVLGYKVDVWQLIFSDLFATRAQKIVSSLFEKVTFEPLLGQCLKEVADISLVDGSKAGPDRDLGEFLWASVAEERPTSDGYAPAHVRVTRTPSKQRSSVESGPGRPHDHLTHTHSHHSNPFVDDRMNGISPKVAQVVSLLDGQLKRILDEIKCLLTPIVAEGGTTYSTPVKTMSATELLSMRGTPSRQSSYKGRSGSASSLKDSRQREQGDASVDQLTAFLQKTCFDCIMRLVGRLRDEVVALADAVQPPKMDPSQVSPSAESWFSPALEQALFIGRVANALAASSQFLSIALSCASPSILAARSPSTPASPRMSNGYNGMDNHMKTHRRAADEDGASALVGDLQRALREVYVSGLVLWVRYTANQLGNMLQDNVHTLFTEVQHRVGHSAAWEEVVLRDDVDAAGSTDEDRIRLPCQASSHVFAFIFTLAKEIHRVGSYTVDVAALQYLTQEMCDRCLCVYNAFISSYVANTQTFTDLEILQLMFDMRFLFDILRSGWLGPIPGTLDVSGVAPRPMNTSPSSSLMMSNTSRMHPTLSLASLFSPDRSDFFKETASRVDQLFDSLQRLMDPIDWATYEKPLAVNVQRYYMRCIVLFGHLVQLNRVLVPSGTFNAARRAPSSTPRSDTNVVPLAKPVPRFTYLPVSFPGSAGANSSQTSRPTSSSNLSAISHFSSKSAGGSVTSIDTSSSLKRPASGRMDTSFAAAQSATQSYLEQVGSNALRFGSGLFGFGTTPAGGADADGRRR
eukprot:CAMPEP_0184674868 /NCGR_PEP_ID=MMETSP0308-20130426/87472_1 /TAXON_ID=38269 /ORGANISM="Gloeochaete witrockiana, Strain SAG 46.84" /LENGTH=1190 /DNA_ID=CAMNT_0027122523 /DNA_START=53 /DNA_END=3625 /DNA_ORIENTATION=+